MALGEFNKMFENNSDTYINSKTIFGKNEIFLFILQ